MDDHPKHLRSAADLSKTKASTVASWASDGSSSVSESEGPRAYATSSSLQQEGKAWLRRLAGAREQLPQLSPDELAGLNAVHR